MSYLQVAVSLVTAIVAVMGVVVSFISISMARQESRAKREDAQRDRFTYAIEHLKDESLAIRMGALFELKKLGLDSPDYMRDIVRILSLFIKERIEERELLKPPKVENGLPKPTDDVFIACDITALFFKKIRCRASLSYLNAEGVYFHRINLQGANLDHARFDGSILTLANLEEARFNKAHFDGARLQQAKCKDANAGSAYFIGADLAAADFRGANLNDVRLDGADINHTQFEGAKGLTGKRLLKSKSVKDAYLDPEIRAEYDRLMAGQDKQQLST